MSFALRAWVAGAGVVCFGPSLDCRLKSLVLLVLDLVQLCVIFIFEVEVSVILLDVVALHVVSDLNLLVHSSQQRDVLCKMSRLESPKDVDVPILEHASSGMVPTFPELCLELKPPVSINVIPFHRALAELELFKLYKVLASTATNDVDKAIVALSISKVRPTSVHEFSLLQHVLF